VSATLDGCAPWRAGPFVPGPAAKEKRHTPSGKHPLA